MISIVPNKQWERFRLIYGEKSIIKKYYWFLFEFGKRITKLFHKHLGQQLETVAGDSEYKKRLVVAEIRDRGRLAWWAVVSKTQNPGDSLDPNETIFTVVPRFEDLPSDPIRIILASLGPWTAETIPFLPSERSGVVISRGASPKEVEEIRTSIQKSWPIIKTKMIEFGLEFENRMKIYKELKVVRDLEVDAMRYEFIMGKPVWRPSFRWIRREGIRKMQKEKDLIKIWVDPSFSKYRTFKHFRLKLNSSELKRLQEFQNKIRQG